MQYIEEIDWILDKKGIIKSEEEYQQNIEFVRSLGKKCDCVGWSKLNLNDSDADEILDKIKEFCKSDGWKARCCYKRSYTEVKSDWFELQTSQFKDNTIADYFKIPDNNGGELYTLSISAYHETNATPKKDGGIFVPERFRNACIKNKIDGVEFCWIADKGKYEAEQYFSLHIDQCIPRIICDRGIRRARSGRFTALGGYLPKIRKIFYDLQFINLQDCYLASDMPEGGIAQAYIPDDKHFPGRNKILIHKDIAEVLLREKALPTGALKPAPIVNKIPGGYVFCKTKKANSPAKEYIDEMLLNYEKLKCTSRPIRKVTEKEALKVMRKAKRERKEDFDKKISKEQVEMLESTDYSALVPYYLVANGGYLSDEYELLSYKSSIETTDEFKERMKEEELVGQKTDGIVFAKCPDGDVVLYLKDSSIIRFSHEEPESVDEWPSLAQFFFDVITEEE